MPIIEGSRGRAGRVHVTGDTGTELVGFGPYLFAGTPTTSLNNIAEKGALCIDTTNALLYINTGTKGTNTWTKVGLQV